MIQKISTKGMSREEWQANRMSLKTIGGSDTGPMLGLSKYKSPYSLWAEKTGKVTPEDISDKEAVRLGNDLEEYVAKRFEEATGKRLRRENNILYNTDYPFAHANPDRLVVGEKAGFEAKTTSSWEILQQCREGKFPDTWYSQVTHYLMVTGYERWYLGVLCFGHGFFHFTIERDEAEIAALASAESNFWYGVCNDIPPAMDGSEATTEALRTIYAESHSGKEADLTAVGFHLQAYASLNSQIAELIEQRDAHQAEVMNFMQDAEKGKYGVYSVSWKTQQRKTFDRKAYEQDHGPIGDQYYKVSTSRPFKVTVKGK